jgi:hypothetical protein
MSQNNAGKDKEKVDNDSK